MQIVLAPMQGVVDHLMRDMLSTIGGFDLCVTEFVRVVNTKLPDKVFYRLCPELKDGGYTSNKTKVKVQLLGQDPEYLAINALTAIRLGSHGVDLNFGCPAKTVNKSKGGAVLLQYPEQLYRIVKAVREAVPAEHEVTAKIRLGFEDTHLAIENAQAIESAGASSLVVHARTKKDGYKPPAYWDWIAKIRQHTTLPIIANGEIWSAQDAENCIVQSDTPHIMLGRGALALPNLANTIRYGEQAYNWEQVKSLLVKYSGYEIYSEKGLYYPNRIKQWFSYLKLQYPEASEMFVELRRMRDARDIVNLLKH
ncbi:tRNA-dihydrouridine synthase [Glaciecola petra]|uniref:tRNA-dihydrouridine(16) synthase n=1 Tax=Glaciecola petra TaxID=3075602 RepID=A0ABU2ZPR4_9ALTE|nr:tRNA-dihydrouridine synthase [Aestuariibacter sp. P117]MDT0594613.1 tRNA-dihydrouridine synthase [Aestuariibacter sp. P117]